MQGLILWTDFERFTCERFWSMHLLMTSLVILRHYDTAIQLLSFVKHVGQFFADFDTSKFNASCLYVLKCAAFYNRHTSILSCCYCNCGCTFLLQHSHHRDLWKIKKYSWCWGLVEDLTVNDMRFLQIYWWAPMFEISSLLNVLWIFLFSCCSIWVSWPV